MARIRPAVVSVIGAKGGVGASVVALNLALALARLEHEVVLVEGDMEGAGVGEMLAASRRGEGIGSWLGARRKRLEEIVGQEIEPRFRVLTRGEGLAPPNPHAQKKRKLITGLKRLEAQFVVVELGRGLMAHDIALSSHAVIVVFTPEAISLAGISHLARALAMRALEQQLRDNSHARGVLERFRYSSGDIPQLISELEALEGLGRSPGEIIGRMRIKLLGNRMRTLDDMAFGQRAAAAVQQATGIIPQVLGFLPEDPLVPRSLELSSPALELEPRARFSMGVALVALGLEPWAGKGAQWAARPPEPGSFERAASEFSVLFRED